jgi:hypothetical protein
LDTQLILIRVVPATVPVANRAPAPFAVTVTISGSALSPPSAPVRLLPFSIAPLLPLVALASVLLIFIVGFWAFETVTGRNRMASCGVFSAAIFCAFLGVAGCGGGSLAVAPACAPPPVVTPSGTLTIVVTPAAVSTTSRPLQLQPIQLTRTVQ